MLALLAACTNPSPSVIPTPTQPPAGPPTPSEPGFAVTSVPDPAQTGIDFLELWKADDYAAMYGMLSSVSQAAISQEAFTARYLNVMIEAAIPVGEMDYEILSTTVVPGSAAMQYRVQLQSVHFGEIARETQMALTVEEGAWRIVWDETMVLPDLAGGNVLRRITIPRTRKHPGPERGVVSRPRGGICRGHCPSRNQPGP
ncbi:MAG: hypothetical protein HC806_02080 [Anaerolineae bacterium]|nr:hypothetical protein [Anaerolineae bacterium]